MTYAIFGSVSGGLEIHSPTDHGLILSWNLVSYLEGQRSFVSSLQIDSIMQWDLSKADAIGCTITFLPYWSVRFKEILSKLFSDQIEFSIVSMGVVEKEYEARCGMHIIRTQT